MPDLAVERTLESVHCSKLTLFHRVIINCTDICISWNWEKILYNNVALILFHGVSPNPLAPKVMMPKLTSRQRMFVYKADQIHRGEDHVSFRMYPHTQVLALSKGVPFFGRHCMPHFCRGELPRNRHNVRCVTWQMVCRHKYAHLP